MALNKDAVASNSDKLVRINLQNSPSWSEGYDANLRGVGYPPVESGTPITDMALLLGWLNAEEDKLLAVMPR